MKRLTGHFTSKRLTYAPPSGALLDDIRAPKAARVPGRALTGGASLPPASLAPIPFRVG